MTRRRWIYQDGVAHEVSLDYVAPEAKRNTDSILQNDRLYQDDGDPRWNSRSQHRQYMKDNDLSMACDFTETWKKAAQERQNISKGIDPSRARDVAQAIQKLRR